MQASFCRLYGLATPCRWRCFAGRRLNDFSLFPGLRFRPRVPTLAPGLSSAQEQPWKSSIAPACFAAGSSGCEGPAIPLGDRYRMTKIRTRHSVGARHAA